MRISLPVVFLLLFFYQTRAQNVINFFCSRDTVIPCPTVTMDLLAKTVDLKNFTAGSTYEINPMTTGTSGGCYAPYVDPGLPGNPVTLNIDDRYSAVIPLGFNFPFFGTVYNSVVVSTNGYISFDITRAGLGSHWQMFGDLPNATYDRGLIMGPYHDLDPSEPTSPTQQIKYDIVGTSPHRRFIFSFYRVPLFNCATLIENTHQIVMYESTGIIEVFIQDKQICNSWNTGRAMIGLQDFSRTQGVMAPGRRSTDPPWGSIGMNESWRFVPSGGVGVSLLKRVELINYAGTIIRNGVIGASTNGYFDVTFPNVAPGAAVTNYIVRSVFEKFDDPAVEIIAHDTVSVTRQPPGFPVTATSLNAPCKFGSGSIEMTSPLGPGYEYSIDGGATWQSYYIFIVPPGTYNILARATGALCAGTTGPITITEPTSLLASTTVNNASDCSNKTGSITITASGGTPPYEYSVDGVNYQPGNVFINLPSDTLQPVWVRDANTCYTAVYSTYIPLTDTMRLELGPDTSICIGQSVQFLPQTNALTDTFGWTPGRPLLDNDDVMNPIATPIDTTKFYLTAKWGVCERLDSITVNIKHKPVVDAGKDTIICNKTFANLNGRATNLSGSVNYAWTPANMVVPPDAPIAVAYPDTSRYFYLTVTDNYNCNFTVIDSVWIKMQPPVPAYAGNDTIAMFNKPHQLEATGGVSFLWSPSSSLNNPFSRTPLAKLTNDQYFEVIVTDNIGCKGKDGVFLRVLEGPTYHVSNAFSPNGDGLNETFKVFPSGISNTEYFRIFDRKGALVFDTRQWLKGWDGNYLGKPALAGTYVWIVRGTDVNGNIVEQKGTVLLIR